MSKTPGRSSLFVAVPALTFLEFVLIVAGIPGRAREVETGQAVSATVVACEELHLVAVKSSENGSTIFISSNQNSFHFDVPTHSLPSPECGRDFHKCNILVFEDHSHIYIIAPFTGGFLWVDYLPREDKPPTVHFQELTIPCNPTKLFRGSRGGVSRVIMSCFNLTAQHDGLGSLYYVDFSFSVANNVTTLNQRVSSVRAPLYGLSSVSEAVYADNLALHGCFIDEEMYVFDQSFPLHTPTEPFRTPVFVAEQPLEDCLEYRRVEYSGLDRLIVYCINQRAVVYSMCFNEPSYYTINSTGVPYPCTADWSYVVYKRRNSLIIVSTDNSNGTEIEFNHEITYGKCVGMTGDMLFWGITENGTLVRVSLSRQGEEVIVSSGHSKNTTCLRPVFSDQGRVQSYLNPTTLSITAVNLTAGHELREVQLPFHPDMYTIHTGPGTGTDACMNVDTMTTTIHTLPTSTFTLISTMSLVTENDTTPTLDSHAGNSAAMVSYSILPLLVIVHLLLVLGC